MFSSWECAHFTDIKYVLSCQGIQNKAIIIKPSLNHSQTSIQGTPSGQRKVSPEWTCPFIRGNKYKDYRNILFFQDQSLYPLNGGVP